MTIAVCPGSFDPITLGHLDIIVRSAYIYDKVVVGVARNPVKKPLFSLEERVEFVLDAVANNEKVIVDSFDGLLVDFVRKHKATVIIKGLRAVSDFEHELQMAHLNKKLDKKIETIFMMAGPEYMFLSSSAVKELAYYKGNIQELVTPKVKEELYKKYA